VDACWVVVQDGGSHSEEAAHRIGRGDRWLRVCRCTVYRNRVDTVWGRVKEKWWQGPSGPSGWLGRLLGDVKC
jgi:hypothetical protein